MQENEKKIERIVDTISSKRSYEATLKKEVSKLARGEVEIKQERLKAERVQSNKRVLEKTGKMQDKTQKQTSQGIQGDQMFFERNFTGP